MAFEYGPITGEEELPALAEILSWSFGFPLPDAEPWIRLSGLERVRVLREDGRPTACLFCIPLGQFFGGRSVSMAGISAVGTAPDRRGSGAALAMMRHLLLELHEKGYALSALYAATRALYRAAGYEPAGTRAMLEVPARRLRLGDRTLDVRPVTDADKPDIEALYREQAMRSPGHLDRDHYLWYRVRNPRQGRARGFVFERNGLLEGYAYLYEKILPNRHYDLVFTDAVARTPDAARRLLTFAGDHSTIGDTVSWTTGPVDPLVMMLPEIEYDVRDTEHWAVRIVDVERALTSRGYPDGVDTEIHLEVHDDLIAENDGRFVLSVEGGRGRVKRGGEGRIRLDVRGLAPLYTGHWTPHALVVSGLVEATDADLARAALAFGGPAPWMADRF